MKIHHAIILLMLIISSSVIDIIPQKMGDSYRLYINKINLPFNRIGNLAEVNISDPDPIISGAGGKIDGKVFLFAGGFFLSGIDNGIVWANAVAPSSLVQDYIAGDVANGQTDPRAQLYRVRRSDAPFSNSWIDWIDAVFLGADYYDGNSDGIYNPVDLNANGIWDPNEDRPDILGDETLWCVYNDGLPTSLRRWNTVPPKGIEIRQTVFAYSAHQPLQNIIFIRYKVLNTGTITSLLDSVYFGIWDDADLGDASDDLVGCNIDLKSQYTYNDGDDIDFGINPPSFLVKLLSGPHSYIPGVTFIDINANSEFDEGVDTPLDTAFYNRGQILGIKSYSGAKNLHPSSMMSYLNSDPILGDPNNAQEARNYILGLTRNGQEVDPCTWPYGTVYGGVNCSTLNNKFWYSGNPITQIGWLHNSPGDVRQMQNIGPFKLKAGKPVEIFLAYTVGRGINALNSLSVANSISNTSLELFNANFDTSSIVYIKEVTISNTPLDYLLLQNYPNPFNSSTKIQYSLSSQQLATIKVYDVLGNDIETLVNEEKPAGIYEVTWYATNLPSGVYFYRIQSGPSASSGQVFIDTKKMILLR
jgi:hypothetical protein